MALHPCISRAGLDEKDESPVPVQIAHRRPFCPWLGRATELSLSSAIQIGGTRCAEKARDVSSLTDLFLGKQGLPPTQASRCLGESQGEEDVEEAGRRCWQAVGEFVEAYFIKLSIN